MTPISKIKGRAALWAASNVDTGQIVPSRFLHRERRRGFGETLFHDLRWDKSGCEIGSFVLNRPACRNPKILVAGSNFGCGSSREHAVWAILDHGIACVIAESFGDIFRNNAFENGLLPIEIPLAATVFAPPAPDLQFELEVDLGAQTVTTENGTVHRFQIDGTAKRNLMLGLTRIAATTELLPQIIDFEQTYRTRFPWDAS
jgi:3-isopropylmalate/(R)-2-methylmalate dehydratase small subunit